MESAFFQKAAALRQRAADPNTDLATAKIMLDTADDMEAAAEQEGQSNENMNPAGENIPS